MFGFGTTEVKIFREIQLPCRPGLPLYLMTVKRYNKLVGTGLRIDYKQSLFQKGFRNNFPNLNSRVSIVALLSLLLPSAAYIENWLAHSLEYVYNQDRDMNITIWSGLIE